ncbi:MAG TPA: protease inhibitor I42 family protein [Desulfuromonadaceae bacterium]
MGSRWGVVITVVLLALPARALELTGRDSGRSVSVPLAGAFSVVLAGNPTTGYLWELAAADREVLAPEGGPEYVPDSSRTGSGGKFTFRFTPRKPGTAFVRLVYRRPWEKGIAPLRTFELTVVVTDAAPQIVRAGYRSASGEVLRAAFDPGLHRVTVTLPGGRRVTLPSAPSGSGARYSNGTETFWEHQGVGRFFEGGTLLFEGTLLPR